MKKILSEKTLFKRKKKTKINNFNEQDRFILFNENNNEL